MGEPEIDVAIKAFDEMRSNTDHADIPQYDLAVGLLALARAVKEMQAEIKELRYDLKKLEKKMR